MTIPLQVRNGTVRYYPQNSDEKWGTEASAMMQDVVLGINQSAQTAHLQNYDIVIGTDSDVADGNATHSSWSTAIAAAIDGNTIFVRKCTLSLASQLVINKKLKIVGTKQASVIQDSVTITNGSMIKITVNDVEFVDVEIQQSLGTPDYAIELSNVNRICLNIPVSGTFAISSIYRNGMTINGMIGQILSSTTLDNYLGTNAYSKYVYLNDVLTSTYHTILNSNSSTALTANRNLTIDVKNADRTLSLSGNLTIGNSLSTGSHTITLNTTGTTSITLPTAGTLSTLDGVETLTSKTLTSPTITNPTLSGGTVVSTVGVYDTNASHSLNLKWNEDDTINRVLNLKVNGSDKTIDLSGNLTLANSFTTSGNFALTLTQTAATNVTLPTTGTLSTLDGSETLTNKTLTSPILNTATINNSTISIPSLSGGTVISTVSVYDTNASHSLNLKWNEDDTINRVLNFKVNGSDKTIDLAGDLTLSGAFALTLTQTAATNVTLPTTGTLTTLAGSEILTNKTLTAPTITNATLSVTNTSGAGVLSIKRNEASAVDYTLTYKVNGASRTIDLGGDLKTTTQSITLNANAAGSILTLPDSGTLATIGNSETFTNKTLTAPTINKAYITIPDIDSSNALLIKWNEGAALDRTLNLALNGVDRSITLTGDLSVSGNATINQDLSTTSATAQLATLTCSTSLVSALITKASADLKVTTTTSGDVELNPVSTISRIMGDTANNSGTKRVLFGSDGDGTDSDNSAGIQSDTSGNIQVKYRGGVWSNIASAAGFATTTLNNLGTTAINAALNYADTNLGLVNIPVGTIIPWIGGYFGNGSNGSYTRVLGTANTIAAVNTLQNPNGWYVCDGTELNLASSPIFNGATRFLPNLSDSRFLLGYTSCGTQGGANSLTTGNASVNTTTMTAGISISNHTVTNNAVTSGAGTAHSHVLTPGTAYAQIGLIDNGTIWVKNYSVTAYSTTGYLSGTYTADSGPTSIGSGVGGSTNTESSHTHGVTSNVAVSNHSFSNATYTVDAHTHSITNSLPQYLTVFYLMKVK